MKRMPWEVTREMFLDEREVASLLRHVRDKAKKESGRAQAAARLDEVIIECLLFSGIRNTELCRLRLGEVSLKGGQGSLRVEAGKEERIVYLPRRTTRLLASYIKEVRPLLLPPGAKAGDPSLGLIFNERRQPYERTGLYRRVVRILTAAGLSDRASVQLLRHTYGYLAYLRTGGNLLFVQRQLGHAHPTVTVVYSKFVQEDYADLADKLDDSRRA